MRLKSKFASISCTPGDEAILVTFSPSDEEGWNVNEVEESVGQFLLAVDPENFREEPVEIAPEAHSEAQVDEESVVVSVGDGEEQEEDNESSSGEEAKPRRGRPRKVQE